MTKYVLSIDCGLSTGAAMLSYEESSPAELVQGWQFGGGVSALIDWCESIAPVRGGYTFIAEKFTARNPKGFHYTTASLEPLRCEGALIALGLMPDYTVAEKRWRDPSLQYFAGGTGKAERKKKQHAFLKANGFYRTGRDLGSPDADDFRSACAHGINYIARELKHRPTFDMISAWGREN